MKTLEYNMKENLAIGIAGGSASGKTTLANKIINKLDDPNITVIKMDSYYKSHPEMKPEERAKINFDHPDAFDVDLLFEHLQLLKEDNPIEMPQYNYKTHLRQENTITVAPYKVIILEGILAFVFENLRNIFDIKLYVDTPSDIRILRRLKRDMKLRGRSFESVDKQYHSTVRPMHLQFVEPSKKYADIIVPRGGFNLIAVDMVVSKIREILAQ